MKITILTDDSPGPNCNLMHEHGLSVFVEHNNVSYLIDVGRTSIFAQNAVKMEINISHVDYAILTHGHYDHTNGLASFLQKNKQARIILSKYAANQRLFSIKNGASIFIGMDPHLQKADHDRIIFLEEGNFEKDNLKILTSISHNHDMPMANRVLMKESSNGLIPDDFNHEIIPCLVADIGLVVFTGCAHQGILNILETVENVYPDITVKAVIGGFHYVNSTENRRYETIEEVRNIAAELARKYTNTSFYTGHCTGDQALKAMQSVPNLDIHNFYPGFSITL